MYAIKLATNEILSICKNYVVDTNIFMKSPIESHPAIECDGILFSKFSWESCMFLSLCSKMYLHREQGSLKKGNN